MRQTYGYIRVSTREQNEARQLDALYKAGVEEKRIYMDKQSGKDFDRQGYQQLLHRLRRGDTLFVKSIDRLGRNYNEILEQWRLITKEKQAAIVVLDMPLLDTRQDRDLTGRLIADIVLQLLSYVARRRSASSSASGSGRASRRPRRGACGSGGRPSRCPRIFWRSGRAGRRVSSIPARPRRCWKSPKTRFARGTHALVTKREVISKKFLLLCVDFLARKCYHTNSSMFCVKLRKQSIFVGI